MALTKKQREAKRKREAEKSKQERLSNSPPKLETIKPVSISTPTILPQDITESETSIQRETIPEKLSRISESNFFMGGGIAVALAAYAFLLTGALKFSILLLAVAWIVITISIYRQNFFEGKSHKTQIISNGFISLSIGVGLSLIWLWLQPEPPQKERPFLVIGDAFLVSPLNSGKFPVGKFKLKNTGKAPATNISSIGKTKLLTKEEVKLVQQGIMPQLEDRRFEPGGVGILGVGESFANSTIPGKDPEGEDKKALISGDYVFCMWIETIYTDLEGKKYFYKSCLFSESVDSTSFRICNKWNESS